MKKDDKKKLNRDIAKLNFEVNADKEIVRVFSNKELLLQVTIEVSALTDDIDLDEITTIITSVAKTYIENKSMMKHMH